MSGPDLRALAAFAVVGLAACGQSNTYVAPPPPKVTVAKPVEQKVTRYFEATGNSAAVNSANLVARVQGFLTEIKAADEKGDFTQTVVKQEIDGTTFDFFPQEIGKRTLAPRKGAYWQQSWFRAVYALLIVLVTDDEILLPRIAPQQHHRHRGEE